MSNQGSEQRRGMSERALRFKRRMQQYVDKAKKLSALMSPDDTQLRTRGVLLTDGGEIILEGQLSIDRNFTWVLSFNFWNYGLPEISLEFDGEEVDMIQFYEENIDFGISPVRLLDWVQQTLESLEQELKGCRHNHNLKLAKLPTSSITA